MDNVIRNLKKATTDQQLDIALKACADVMKNATDTQKKAISVAISIKTDEILLRSKQTRIQAEELLRDIEFEKMTVDLDVQRQYLAHR